jgi:hypothetical protein
MLTKKPKAKTEETTDAGPMMAFDKRLQQREKPKKAGGFGKPKPKAEAAPAEEAAPPGTFFKPKKVEKKSSFRR